MPSKIFINYRRDDDPAFAARIRDGLAAAFGKSSVFMDVDNLLAGQRFDKQLDKALAQCDVLVAVMGPRWMEILRTRAPSNKRDHVREEIAAALKRNVVVIPVRVGREGSLPSFPESEELPEDIRDLALHQKHDVAHERFGRDIAELIAAIKVIRREDRRPLPWGKIAAGLLVVAALGGAAYVGGPLLSEWGRVSEAEKQKPAVSAEDQSQSADASAKQSADEERKQREAAAAETKRKADHEQQRQAALASEEKRKAEEAEAKRKDEERQREAAAADAKRKANAEQQRQAALAAEEKRKADEALAKRKAEAEEGERQRVATEKARTQQQAATEAAKGSEGTSTAKPSEEMRQKTGSQTANLQEGLGSGDSHRKPGEAFRDCADTCPEMIVISAGEFMMGSLANEEGRDSSEGPRHKVKIARPFAAAKFEATFAEWDACVLEGGCKTKPEDKQGWGRDKRPVINVSWREITQEYLPWLSQKTGKNYRLLTEAQWEYAARAGTKTPFSTGGTITSNEANFDGDYTYGRSAKGHFRKKTLEVGSFAPNAFALHDMHGNVWEWVQDCYHEEYAGAPTDGSEWTTQCVSDTGILRGGTWSFIPQALRSANRGRYSLDFRSSEAGFRVARDLD